VGLPLLSVVEVEMPVDTSVVRLFASPWNGQQATFLLRCSYPFAVFNYSTSSASPTAYSPVHAVGNVSTENGDIQVQLDLTGWPDGSYVTVAACSRQGDRKRDASPSEVEWKLDNTPPTTSISSHPPSLVASSNAALVFSCSETNGGCTYEYWLDAAEQWTSLTKSLYGPGDLFPPSINSTITAITQLRDVVGVGEPVSGSAHLSFVLSTTATSAVQLEYRIFREGLQPPNVWSTLNGFRLSVLRLQDGNMHLEARVVGLSSSFEHHPTSVLSFSVSSTYPRSRYISGHTGPHGAVHVSMGIEPAADCVSACSVVAAVRYSLDGQSWQRSPGHNLTLQGVGAGSHRLHVSVENAAGNFDAEPMELDFELQGEVTEMTEVLPLYLVQGPGTDVGVGSEASFTVGGLSAGKYAWRIDGEAWDVVEDTPVMSHSFSKVGVHHWEAIPLSVYMSSPLLHSWGVGLEGDLGNNLNLLSLSDGNHSIAARAKDAAGL
jgi:hypothetical protein